MILCCLSLMDVQWITALVVTNPIQKNLTKKNEDC